MALPRRICAQFQRSDFSSWRVSALAGIGDQRFYTPLARFGVNPLTWHPTLRPAPGAKPGQHDVPTADRQIHRPVRALNSLPYSPQRRYRQIAVRKTAPPPGTTALFAARVDLPGAGRGPPRRPTDTLPDIRVDFQPTPKTASRRPPTSPPRRSHPIAKRGAPTKPTDLQAQPERAGPSQPSAPRPRGRAGL